MKSFKFIGILGGKKQVKSLGAFMIVVFGLTAFILGFSNGFWWLWIGVGIGIVLLLGGIFASDTSNNPRTHYTNGYWKEPPPKK